LTTVCGRFWFRENPTIKIKSRKKGDKMKKLKVLSISAVAVFAASLFSWLSFAPQNIEMARAAETDNYIQFTGGINHIDTNITSVDAKKVVVDFQYDAIRPSAAGVMFGARYFPTGDSATRQDFMFGSNPTAWSVWAGNSSGGNFGTPDTNRHTFEINQQNQTFALDGDVHNIIPNAYFPPTNTINIYLGRYNIANATYPNGGAVTGTDTFNGKIYSFQIYNASGQMIQNLIPVNSCQVMGSQIASAPGFYDSVTDAIFYNRGGGNLTYVGNDDGKCAVSFNANGGSAVDAQSVDHNAIVAQPTDPTRAGYRFASWFTDSELTAPADFATGITADTIFYAKWDALCEYDSDILATDEGCVAPETPDNSETDDPSAKPIVPGSPDTGF
jgi:uncharacterized repeat protein (TIGR02543 family)